MRYIYKTLAIFLTALSCSAQLEKNKIETIQNLVKKDGATKSSIVQAEFIGFRNTPGVDKDWRPYLSTKISENESENNEKLEKIKKEQNKLKFSTNAKSNNTNKENSTQAITPVIGTNFIGIDNAGVNQPLDNSIAVSNGGYIVTCVNSKIEIDDINGNYYYGQSLQNFINDASLSTNLCDPKVIYDSGADRFIFFCQTCDRLAASSKIVIGFSVNNNPNNGFYFYKLSGNPLNNNCWFDYPKIAVSNNELYITGNLFGNSGGPFNQVILFQIPKAAGFSGGSLNYQYWNNISGSPFTLLPVSNGQQGNYGPGVYLVSTDGVTSGSSNINLYDLTNDMSASNEQLNHYNVTTTNYSTGGNTAQLGGTKLLESGDSRTLDGFYLNGIIHFVFHSNIGSGYNGINYNRLNPSTTSNVSSIFGLSGTYDYCFPAVASIASTATDKSVIISFSRCGASVYPEVRAVNCDDNMNWSNSTNVRSGDSFISYSWNTGTTERWGDYSGISRKHNANPPRVWVSGDYGNSQNYWGQWIAEISTTSVISITENNYELTQTKIYPNPIIDIYKIEFDLKKEQSIQISIFDIQGKMIKELYSGHAQKGTNFFTFNKANLNSGTYFINIILNSKSIKNEKIVIADK